MIFVKIFEGFKSFNENTNTRLKMVYIYSSSRTNFSLSLSLSLSCCNPQATSHPFLDWKSIRLKIVDNLRHSFVGLDSWSLKLAHIFNLKEHVGAWERPTRTTKMSWWWGSSPSTTMARIKGKQFLYIFSLAFWDLFQIWEFWLDFDMIWFGKCWLWLIPLLGWLSYG